MRQLIVFGWLHIHRRSSTHIRVPPPSSPRSMTTRPTRHMMATYEAQAATDQTYRGPTVWFFLWRVTMGAF
jgi:hypothetical protein